MNKDPNKENQAEPQKPAKPNNDDAAPPRIPSVLTGRTYMGIVDQKIAEAEAQGAFRNLPGSGKPLQLDDDSLVPEEDRVAFRILKNAGYAPPWIELQKRIFEDQAAIEKWLQTAQQRWLTANKQQRELLRNDYRDRLRDLAKLIDYYNLIIPKGMRQMPGVRVLEELKKLG